MKRIRFALLASLALLFISIPISSQLKKQDGFCISCHLPSGKPLHKKKQNDFVSRISSNLADAHRLKSKKRFNCSSCHDGHGITQRAKLFGQEIYNTVYYFLATVEEPKKLDENLMPDSSCTFCHALPIGSSGKLFHGSNQHRPKVKNSCISCHTAHKHGSGKYSLNKQVVLKQCAGCHPNLSPAFLSVLPPRFRE